MEQEHERERYIMGEDAYREARRERLREDVIEAAKAVVKQSGEWVTPQQYWNELRRAVEALEEVEHG